MKVWRLPLVGETDRARYRRIHHESFTRLNEAHAEWLTAPPFYVGHAARMAHRPSDVSSSVRVKSLRWHNDTDGVSVHLTAFCGAIGSLHHGTLTQATALPVCSRCEELAVRRGLPPSHEILGYERTRIYVRGSAPRGAHRGAAIFGYEMRDTPDGPRLVERPACEHNFACCRGCGRCEPAPAPGRPEIPYELDVDGDPLYEDDVRELDRPAPAAWLDRPVVAVKYDEPGEDCDA